MPDVRDVRSLLSGAEQAAAAGDHGAAAALLREAADLQEATLGPDHPDLANTLNNLGVVNDMANRVAEAELCYRRAYAIAVKALPAGHPFVATSWKNLSDFCQARGIPFEIPAPPPAPTPAPPAPPAPRTVSTPAPPSPVTPRPSHAPAPPPAPPPQASRPVPPEPVRKEVEAPPLRAETPPLHYAPASSASSRAWIVAAVVLALLLVVLTIAAVWWDWDAPSNPPPASAAIPPPAEAPATPAPQPPAVVDAPPAEAAQPPPPPPPAADPTPAAPAAEASPDPAPPPAGARGESGPGTPEVAAARVCQSLAMRESPESPGDWQCEPAGTPARQGPLFFYTRIASSRDTTVQHRWYREDSLRQVVELRVRANANRGFRTYSRNTAWNSGDWRVELRSADGTLLHEERFTVR